MNHLFETAYEILEQIPEQKLALEKWIQHCQFDEEKIVVDCNTLACGAGHLCLNPVMQKAGLRFTSVVPALNGVVPALYTDGEFSGIGFNALAGLFDIPWSLAIAVFAPRHDSSHEDRFLDPPLDIKSRMTDKELILLRMRTAMHLNGLHNKEIEPGISL